MDEWVIVEVAGSEPEAELLCSVLRGSGMVSPQDAQDAREILHEAR